MTTVEFEHGIQDSVLVKALGMIGRVDSLTQDVQGKQYRVVYWNDG